MNQVWKGPYEDGVTYSLLAKWLQCRERFRIYAIEGLQEEEEFNTPIIYGSMWHIYAETYPNDSKLLEYARELANKYVHNKDDIAIMYNVVKHQYEAYLEYWKEKNNYREDIVKEKEFKFEYNLPGVKRPILLRGKIDCICRIKSVNALIESDAASLFDSIRGGKEILAIEETKTKSKIELQIGTVLGNLQTIIYHLAAREHLKLNPTHTIYNLVVRPIGKIRRRKDESRNDFISRMKKFVDDNFGGVFKKYLVKMSDKEFLWGKTRILDPILRQFCLWYDSIVNEENPFNSPYHYQMPWGIYNPILIDMKGDYYDYLVANDSSRLVKVSSLFKELDGDGDE